LGIRKPLTFRRMGYYPAGMKDYKAGSHTLWDCKYHLVWVAKYRYAVLSGDVGERVHELLRQTDLTPEKPGTDITFLGKAYAPGGKPAKSWTCSIEAGPVSKTLLVHGERFWRPVFRDAWAGLSAKEPKRVLQDWTLTDTAPAAAMPLDWTHAFGGAEPGSEIDEHGIPAASDASNPLGCGIVDPGCTDSELRIRAPSVTAPGQADLDWRQRYEPQGFGPIRPGGGRASAMRELMTMYGLSTAIRCCPMISIPCSGNAPIRI
jgi:hypothetical protein